MLSVDGGDGNRSHVARYLQPDPADVLGDGMTADRVQFAKQLLSRRWMDEAQIKTSTPSVKYVNRLTELLRQASLNPDQNTFDMLTAIAAEFIRQGHGNVLPDWLANFAADVLSGKVKRPRKKGEDQLKIWRDFGYWRASFTVAKRYNLPLYTNNELYEGTTAAKIVSQAAGCKVDLIVQAIKKSQRRFGGKDPDDIFPQDSSG